MPLSSRGVAKKWPSPRSAAASRSTKGRASVALPPPSSMAPSQWVAGLAPPGGEAQWGPRPTGVASGEGPDCAEPVDGAHRHLERRGVVETAADRVVVEERADLRLQLGARRRQQRRVQTRRRGQLDEMAAARQLPGALGIDAVGEQAFAAD